MHSSYESRQLFRCRLIWQIVWVKVSARRGPLTLPYCMLHSPLARSGKPFKRPLKRLSLGDSASLTSSTASMRSCKSLSHWLLVTKRHWNTSTNFLSTRGRLIHNLRRRFPKGVVVWFSTANNVPRSVKSVWFRKISLQRMSIRGQLIVSFDLQIFQSTRIE